MSGKIDFEQLEEDIGEFKINWTKEGKFIGWKLNFFAVGCNI
jgi:hypothetical protein